MSTDTQITEPEDDAVVVSDAVDEEANDNKLVEDVTKLLEEPGEVPEEKPGEDEPEEQPGEVPEEGLDTEVQARAEAAGISRELAEKLNQTGHLEETITAIDKNLIERFSTKPEKVSKVEDQKQTVERPFDDPPKSLKPLKDYVDADGEHSYDDVLIERDEYHQSRIDSLEAQLTEFAQSRESDFDKRFDHMVDELGYDDVFGAGTSVSEDNQAKRDTLFKAYQAICQAYDVNPNEANPQFGKRALAAMFPDEVVRQSQKKTVDRLRDAEGKFLTSSKPKGTPPQKDMTEDESYDHLVSKVTSYLKEQGAQLSGV
jgi:hypothetical protein